MKEAAFSPAHTHAGIVCFLVLKVKNPFDGGGFACSVSWGTNSNTTRIMGGKGR